jgi:hypothetical protein
MFVSLTHFFFPFFSPLFFPARNLFFSRTVLTACRTTEEVEEPSGPVVRVEEFLCVHIFLTGMRLDAWSVSPRLARVQ